jgi:hypothetical protein
MAHVADGFWSFGRFALDVLSREGEPIFIDVAYIRHLNVLPLAQQVKVIATHATGADHSDHKLVFGGRPGSDGSQGRDGGRGSGGLQEGSTLDRVHAEIPWYRK